MLINCLSLRYGIRVRGRVKDGVHSIYPPPPIHIKDGIRVRGRVKDGFRAKVRLKVRVQLGLDLGSRLG